MYWVNADETHETLHQESGMRYQSRSHRPPIHHHARIWLFVCPCGGRGALIGALIAGCAGRRFDSPTEDLLEPRHGFGVQRRQRVAVAVAAAARRSTREQQARLVPPLLVGRLNPLLKKLFDGMSRAFGAVPSDTAIVSGTPASPGRASGVVRGIRGPEQFDELEPGEILVASITAPAWTPLFPRAAAVVTDVGSPAAHASIIAREYGIPAVVGCGDATARLRTGMRVTVDGSTGNVEPA